MVSEVGEEKNRAPHRWIASMGGIGRGIGKGEAQKEACRSGTSGVEESRGSSVVLQYSCTTLRWCITGGDVGTLSVVSFDRQRRDPR